MSKWSGSDDLIRQISALKRQDYRDMAQETLEKVYRYVLPIMRNRKYRVGKLVEFLPKNQNLLGLNVNHGQSISLRLRYHHNPREFLPFESVLGTMLHELCHNTYGPHDSKFFGLLDELTNEMEDLLAKGYKGDPFLGAGRTLGSLPRFPGSSSSTVNRRTPLYSGRRGGIGKGRKLGGSSSRSKKVPIHILALEAAERRRQADKACKTADKIEDLSSDDRGEVIDLTGSSDDDSDDKYQRPTEEICILDD